MPEMALEAWVQFMEQRFLAMITDSGTLTPAVKTEVFNAWFEAKQAAADEAGR